MRRPSPIVGLAAATLALLVGCGNESTSAETCRNGYVKLYTAAVKLLNEASPSDSDIDDRMTKVLGGEVPKGCKENPRLANKILDQVEQEFDAQLAPLEGKWGRETISGFRNPLGAGHGEPVK